MKYISTYRLQLVQCAVGLVDPYQQLVESMLELTQVQQSVLQLLLALDHATE